MPNTCSRITSLEISNIDNLEEVQGIRGNLNPKVFLIWKTYFSFEGGVLFLEPTSLPVHFVRLVANQRLVSFFSLMD